MNSRNMAVKITSTLDFVLNAIANKTAQFVNKAKGRTKLVLPFVLYFLNYSLIATASIRKPMEIAIRRSWKRMVFLNHCAKLTSASPRPTRSVPQVG